jgi:acyl-CoA thioester hydrolase
MHLQALPVHLDTVIPVAYLDEMGHMNVMWYNHLFSEATGRLFDAVGLTRTYLETNRAGTFALEHHVRYLVEVRAGQRIRIHTRVLGRSAKRFHFMHFMVKEENSILAATGEFVGTHIDMTIRRSSPFPAPIADAFDRLLAEHHALPWSPPVCGVMKP